MNALSDLLSPDEIAASLPSKADFRPFPTIERRDAWEQLPADLRTSIIAEGEAYLGFEWPRLTAAMYMEFLRNGNRTRYDGPYHKRRRAVTSLALAECIENEGRFLDDLVDGVWLIAEETSWVISAHNRMFQRRRPDLPDVSAVPGIDLFALETGGLFAWLHYLLRPALNRIHPLIDERIVHEVRRRILEPYLLRDDCWWMGIAGREKRLNNWTPWCTSNCLAAFLLVEEDAGRRLQAVRKSLASLDRFLAEHPADGGCDEGPGYWNKSGGSLFDCLELLYGATGGRFDPFAEPLVRNIGAYIHKAHIHGDFFLNFADGPPRIAVEGDLAYRYGKRIGDGNLTALGSAFHRALGPEGWKKMKFLSFLRVLPALFNYAAIDGDPAAPAFSRDVWMDGIQVMAARESEAPDRGLYVAMKGGHNEESHNHNDVGHFVLYADGLPVLVDVGVEEYTARTFGAERYDIWTMQSAYHSVPTINGVMQRNGSRFRAAHASYEAAPDASRLTLELASAYPPEAGIASWSRTCRLVRCPQAAVELAERFAFADPSACRFTLNYVACCRPDADPAGAIVFRRDGRPALRMEYDAGQFAANVETIELEDRKLKHSWGERLYRIVLTPRNAVPQGGFTIRFLKA
ncbi:heparinase II/III domain-containing protein [Paenibacillus sp. GYB003]|uniref:heparinase II/III domain-containing protein n=1 Tax=Paenibacillus sp. GYB003 TaxID=2994392 RepID=UPI002F9634C6